MTRTAQGFRSRCKSARFWSWRSAELLRDHRSPGNRSWGFALSAKDLQEYAMETVETVMAEQLDAIIRRLNKRIDTAPSENSQQDRPAMRTLKRNLGRMKSIRAHFKEMK
jgi:hypothetical protein